MSALEISIAEVRDQLERLKIRVARIEKEPKVVVITTGDLDALQAKSGKSRDRCLVAIRDAGGNLSDAAALLEAA